MMRRVCARLAQRQDSSKLRATQKQKRTTAVADTAEIARLKKENASLQKELAAYRNNPGAKLPMSGDDDVVTVDIAWKRQKLRMVNLPPGGTVRLTNPGDLTTTPKNFRPLLSAPSATNKIVKPTRVIMDPSMGAVTTIGRGFLSRCSTLEAVDLTPLSNVTIVDEYFLRHCSRLRAVDLTPLSKVTRVCRGFLQGCTALKAVDLSSLSSVTRVGGGFLSASRRSAPVVQRDMC